MKKRSWLQHNYPLLAMMSWIFFGVTVAYVLVPLIPLPRSILFRLLIMVVVGSIFGWVGFRLAIVIEKKNTSVRSQK